MTSATSVYSLFVVAPILGVGFVLVPCFVVWFQVSFLVYKSSCGGRESWSGGYKTCFHTQLR